MKKIISILILALCLGNVSNAQVRDSSMKKNPRTNSKPMQDTMMNKNHNRNNNTKDRRPPATDSSMNKGVLPDDRKNNPPDPQTIKPQ